MQRLWHTESEMQRDGVSNGDISGGLATALAFYVPAFTEQIVGCMFRVVVPVVPGGGAPGTLTFSADDGLGGGPVPIARWTMVPLLIQGIYIYVPLLAAIAPIDNTWTLSFEVETASGGGPDAGIVQGYVVKEIDLSDPSVIGPGIIYGRFSR